MKYFKYLIILSTLFIFAACANQNSIDLPVREGEPEQLPFDGQETSEVSQSVDLVNKQNQLNQLVQAGVVENCQQLESEQFIITCQAEIVAREAIQREDISICDNALLAEATERCRFLWNKERGGDVPTSVEEPEFEESAPEETALSDQETDATE